MANAPATVIADELPSPAERPEADVVIYDGHCQFCRRQVKRLNWFDCQKKLAYVSLHDPEVASRYPDLSHEQLMREMVVVERGGRRHGGADAFRYLSRRLRRLWWAMPFLHIPGLMWLWRWLYRVVANNRYLFGGKHDCDDGSCSLHRG